MEDPGYPLALLNCESRGLNIREGKPFKGSVTWENGNWIRDRPMEIKNGFGINPEDLGEEDKYLPYHRRRRILKSKYSQP